MIILYKSIHRIFLWHTVWFEQHRKTTSPHRKSPLWQVALEAVLTDVMLLQVQKSKSGTGRVVCFKELGFANAYTVEASFCGPSIGRLSKHHYNTGK
jgi:hypothetical protein